jgi:hypothetical protein
VGGKETGQRIVAAAAAGDAPLELVLAAERAQKIGLRQGVVAGPPHIADAQEVGFVFLALRILGQHAGADELADLGHLPTAGEDTEQGRRQIGGGGRVDPLGRMPPRDVTDLVRQHAGDLGLGVGQRQETAGDVDIAARQGEGVDDG